MIIDQEPGRPTRAFLKPTTTGYENLYTTPSDLSQATLHGLMICLHGAANVSVSLYDGVTDEEILDALSKGANTYEYLQFEMVINPGKIIRVKSSVGSNASFTATISELRR